MTDTPDLCPATSDEVTSALSFALRYTDRKRIFQADELVARIAAERLAEHLMISGFVVMKKPEQPTPANTAHMPPTK